MAIRQTLRDELLGYQRNEITEVHTQYCLVQPLHLRRQRRVIQAAVF
jgi:hypothetical protein